MHTAYRTLAFAAALLPAAVPAQTSFGDSKITCTQRVDAATGSRDLACQNARATFVSDVVKSDRSRRVRIDEVVTAPPIGPMSVTDLVTTRAAAAASRMRRSPVR